MEEIHAGLFKEAITAMSKDSGKDYYVCPVCGNTVLGGAPDKCPICKEPGSHFMPVN